MPKFCVLRIKNMKSEAGLRNAYNHQYRFSEAGNIDKTRESLNEIAVNSNGTFDDIYRDEVRHLSYYHDHLVHKNATKGFDILFTYSPSAAGTFDVAEWKKENIKWLQDTFGKENVKSVVFHCDEASAIKTGTLHGHAFVIPVDDRGHINASHFTGSREDQVKIQTAYAKAMKQFGLERGVEGSRAHHEERRHFYGRLREERERPMPERDMGETGQEFEQRLKEAFKEERAQHVRENAELDKKIRDAEMKESPNPELEEKVNLTKETLERARLYEAELTRQYKSRKEMNRAAADMDELNRAVLEAKDPVFSDGLAERIARLAEFAAEEKRKKEKEKEREEEISS